MIVFGKSLYVTFKVFSVRAVIMKYFSALILVTFLAGCTENVGTGLQAFGTALQGGNPTAYLELAELKSNSNIPGNP